jgi:hypothetical protein
MPNTTKSCWRAKVSETVSIHGPGGCELCNMLLTIIVFLIALAIWYFIDRTDHTVLTFLPTTHNKAILEECTTIKLYDNIPIWGFNGHVQSYFASQIRKGPSYPFRRFVFLTHHY